ncbi:MAG: hypothetical protein IIY21_20845 [Clostridiales bacterium]|nr:hypothetical protein [Clostridiales bacterium]
MTVGDRIRSMTDQEISDMLCNLMLNDCDSCPFNYSSIHQCPKEGYKGWVKSEWNDDYYDGGFYSKYMEEDLCIYSRKTHKAMDTHTQI